jgi:hypothetical protein
MMQADKGMRAGDNGSGADQTGVAISSDRPYRQLSASMCLCFVLVNNVLQTIDAFAL